MCLFFCSAPVAMSEIERMAALCMKDLDDEDMGDEDLDDDEDFLAELNEVLEDDVDQPPAPTPPAVTPTAPKANSTSCSTPPSGVESSLMERIEMYKTAISNAKAAGETSKVRRYERGLKTLQTMLTSAKKGKPINEEEMPPPVAVGGKSSVSVEPPSVEEPGQAEENCLFFAVLSRQREYKLAAIQAKQNGDIDLAKEHYRTAKKLDSLLEAVDRGEQINLSSLPSPPGQEAPTPQTSTKPVAPIAPTSTPDQLPAPSSVAEALQQRMDIYKSAAEGAKSKGDERKSRMHQRIVKQYQDSIKSLKAGRNVNLSDLPVPPGCPPLQGAERTQEQNFVGVLETAMKIANQDPDAEEEDDDEEKSAAKVKPCLHKQNVSYEVNECFLSYASFIAQQQLDFLLLRRQAFLRAALHSKQKKDMSGAAQHLRHVKGLDPMIDAAKSGLPVDITKIPGAPVSEDDYSLARSRNSPVSPRSSEKYHGLMELLKKQHEVNIHTHTHTHTHTQIHTTTTNLELIECMKNIEILRDAYAKGHPVPKCHTEERTFNSVKINDNLTDNELVLYIIRGVNLPAPPGVTPNDLDASVKFEFPFPSTEEAQRDKTSTVKNTNSPEFKEQFRLNINRSHRGFKRLVQSKGIKFEIIHKGGLFKNDKVVGTAQLKLEALENHCEIREIIEVMDGRRATGGKLEVRAKMRKPLSGVDLQPVTEKWVVLEPAPSPRSKPRHEAPGRSHGNHSPPRYKLHSFCLLNYDKERLERKLAEYRKSRRDPPSDLIHQHKEVTHRLHWQKAHLERASPSLLTGSSHTHTHTHTQTRSIFKKHFILNNLNEIIIS
uniref:Coiled-coil and C2 domain-containing protein 1B n=1 Tax=Gouania willdenowi TaxID=441366 RepID=A0A8C5EAI5_GOUWI